tara:strand:+ start:248 stop:583 length:336 start_codon:yes stop_codon:yes gene_type:complete
MKTKDTCKPYLFIIMTTINWFNGRESTRQLPAECIADCSGSGDATKNVKFWVKRLDFDGPKELFKEHLKEFGAWDSKELEDHEENRERVLWTWACNCYEEPGAYDYLYLGV